MEGSFEPCRMRDWTVGEARTWWVRSMAMMVVLGAMMGWLKMDSEASGSHYLSVRSLNSTQNNLKRDIRKR